MSLAEISENEGVVLIEMQLKQVIDNNVDDYELREDGTFAKREDPDIIASFREF